MRLAEEARLAEERRLQEAIEAEERRKAEEAARAEEERKQVRGVRVQGWVGRRGNRGGCEGCRAGWEEEKIAEGAGQQRMQGGM